MVAYRTDIRSVGRGRFFAFALRDFDWLGAGMADAGCNCAFGIFIFGLYGRVD